MVLVPNWDYCRIFEIRCSCGGAWVLRSEHDDWSFGRLLGVEKKSVLTYVCNRMKECYGMGMRHHPVYWQVRCQNRHCSQGAPVVLRGEDIRWLPGFQGFDRRGGEFYQQKWFNSASDYVCPQCAKEVLEEDEKARLQGRYCSLLKDSLPSRPALRYCDIARDYHQTFKKSVKGRRGLNGRADNVFYSHVLYRDNLHENRVEALENTLDELRRGHPQDPYIQSMQHEFFWKQADDGLLTHALCVGFPSGGFSITLNV